VDRIFREAAKAALYAWKQDNAGLEDLVNDIWVWYLESPKTQQKLKSIEKHEAVKSVKRAALQMLSKNQLTSNEFFGMNLYSSESVKEALLGVSKNHYLVDILPRAIEALGELNEVRAEAIRSRYVDGTIPVRQSKEQVQLSKSVKSLTEHVNIIAITAGVDSQGNVKEGPGSRNSVFPETRRVKGSGHSDPTGDIAMVLIEHPEVRDEYLEVQPIREFLGGRGYAQPA
jgi:hypothetical protein